jgi:hypothetical protein
MRPFAYLSTTPWWRMREWRYSSTYTQPQRYMEVSDQPDGPAASSLDRKLPVAKG